MDDNIINLQNATKAPLVYFSTCGLYSKSVDYFHKENSSERLIPRSPYFEAKMRGELKFRQISNSVVFRLSAPVSTSLKPHLVLGRMIHSARNQGSISVYGSGMREQDFILTGDINSAVMKSLSNEIYGTYNLCSSRPVTMLSLAETVAKHIKGVEIRVGEKEDINEGDRARYDNSRLRNSIDWNPTSSMSEIIKRIMY
jgi:nucleoside-diphosphate-sugar epimerase